MCKKVYIWNPDTSSCENGKYVGSITNDSVNMCDEIINAVAESYGETTKST